MQDDLPIEALHLRYHRYAAQAVLTSYVVQLAQNRGEGVEDIQREFPWLEGVVQEFRSACPDGIGWQEGPNWLRDELERHERGADPRRLPLLSVAELAGADLRARIALVLVALVEDDVRFGSLFESLQRPVAGRRPCIGLVEEALSLVRGRTSPIDPWIAAGLVHVEDEQAPRVERSLRVDPALWRGLVGGRQLPPSGVERVVAERGRTFETALEAFRETEPWSGLSDLLGVGSDAVLAIRGRRGSGRRGLLAAAVGASGGEGLLIASVDAEPRAQREILSKLAMAAALSGDLPVVEADLGPGETVDLEPLAGHRGPVAVLMRRDGGVEGLRERDRLTLEMPRPKSATLTAAWRDGLGPGGAAVAADELAATVRLPLELVRRAARGAREAAHAAGREGAAVDDLRRSIRSLGSSDLDRLAHRVEARGSWADLVTSPDVLAELELIERACRLGDGLVDGLGQAFRAVEPRGTKVLLHGPSGVGKTLAVRILAAELAKDLYIADLGALHDKWVGESEKAVSRLLAAAEERDVVLLIDEGDALFGKRTASQGASERFGNLLTNHLLTRLESFEGILAVTTNSVARTDPAFARRFDAVIALPAPNVERRLEIFRRHLPLGTDEGQLDRLARVGPLSGGQIRNAVLHAARLAAAEERELRFEDFELGARRELRRSGVPSPVHTDVRRGMRGTLERSAETRT